LLPALGLEFGQLLAHFCHTSGARPQLGADSPVDQISLALANPLFEFRLLARVGGLDTPDFLIQGGVGRNLRGRQGDLYALLSRR
jgi:hypothetical protein